MDIDLPALRSKPPHYQFDPSAPSPLVALPPELLQHVILHSLLPHLHNNRGDEGEILFRKTTMALVSACRTTRIHALAVLRMLRQEIAVGGMLVEYVARPLEMRVLVLSLDWNLTGGSAVRVQWEQYRGVWRRGPRLKRNGEGRWRVKCDVLRDDEEEARRKRREEMEIL
jgi:hypothetical protein